MSSADSEPGRSRESEGKTANLIYILYLASIVIGVTSIIGVIMAYVYRGDAPDWLRSHYQFQIRTFWISVLIGVIAALTVIFFVGIVIIVAWLVWFIVRCAKGIKFVGRGEPFPNPKSWMFG